MPLTSGIPHPSTNICSGIAAQLLLELDVEGATVVRLFSVDRPPYFDRFLGGARFFCCIYSSSLRVAVELLLIDLDWPSSDRFLDGAHFFCLLLVIGGSLLDRFVSLLSVVRLRLLDDNPTIDIRLLGIQATVPFDDHSTHTLSLDGAPSSLQFSRR